MEQQREMLCHFLAALAYRTQKALRGAPDSYPDFRASKTSRTPHELVWHMTGVLGYARTFFHGGVWQPGKLATFNDEVSRFHEVLESLSNLFASGAPMHGITEKQMLQGPLADAMTHTGQLAMLRRLAGSPVAPENFIRANVSTENLGIDQPAPAAPDPGWDPDMPPTPPGKGLPKDW